MVDFVRENRQEYGVEPMQGITENFGGYAGAIAAGLKLRLDIQETGCGTPDVLSPVQQNPMRSKRNARAFISARASKPRLAPIAS
jgi:hypothetical protein